MTEDTALVPRDAEQQRVERALTRLDRLAKLMDDQFEIPIIKVRIGLDPLIGLVPGGGDWVSWMVSIYILFEALRLRVPVKVLLGIGYNATADLIIGYVPGAGDLLDVVFKANRRSVRLIMEWFEATPNSKARDLIQVPKTALEKPKAGFERWGVALVLVTILTAVGSLPIVLFWMWLTGG